MKLKHLTTVGSGLLLSSIASGALAHGLMVEPASRNATCGHFEKPDQATTPACVEAFQTDSDGGYQFMSVLTHTQGRKAGTSENVCGFDSTTFDGQTNLWDLPLDWPTTAISSGPLTITWDISWGPHWDDTEEFVYYITREDFQYQEGVPLTWSDFEAEPFCDLSYDDTQPDANPAITQTRPDLFHTHCDVPARSGRHVIYGEWGRNEFTYERFHGCLDVTFDGTGTNPGGGDVPVPSPGDDTDYDPAPGDDSDTGYDPAPGDDSDTGFDPAPGTGDAAQCDWYGTLTPLCTTTDDGWGFESGESCVSAATCSSQPEPWGLADGSAPPPASDPGEGDDGSNGSGSDDDSVGGGDPTPPAEEPAPPSEPSVPSDGATAGACDHVIDNQWNGGFTGAVRITNTGSSDINGWEVNWEYADGTVITSSWGAALAGSNPYTAENLPWNQVIAPGETIEIGFQAETDGDSVAAPTVTGSPCS